VQAAEELHSTPLKKLNCARLGFGVATICHLVPFHRSASVNCVPDALP
jgi:hypothetical protein